MKFDVEPEMVMPIVRDQIAAAVVAQLGNTDELMRSMVHAALCVKVNSKGTHSQYQSENKFDFVEAIAGQAIREAATAAIQQIVKDMQPEIQSAIEKELRRAPKRTAQAILSGFIDGVQAGYRIKANFTIHTGEE